ncbi:hypothetical protein JOD54_000579 [Actinokineospora baliensis]|uniref:hypothetical protein n=1 Tax=Actinokineospora baliensis TaxID=547056 RepID=UPI001959BF0B|nr:hypothetical protein [Actinokineospora baliensis]MBM7770375.1 hypothetical protein [Actinokineospora baliensis]
MTALLRTHLGSAGLSARGRSAGGGDSRLVGVGQSSQLAATAQPVGGVVGQLPRPLAAMPLVVDTRVRSTTGGRP